MFDKISKRVVVVGLLAMSLLVCACKAEPEQSKGSEKQSCKASEKYPVQSASTMPKFLDVENGPQGEGWIHLFNGKDLSGWVPRETDHPMSWKIQDGILANTSTSHEERGIDIYTEERFKDFEIYYEYRVPKDSNSGVYLRGRYEIQIWDQKQEKPSWNNGAIFNFAAPSQDAGKEAGQWQSVYARLVGQKVTVILNGVKVIDNVELTCPTGAELATVSVEINGRKIINNAMVNNAPWGGGAETITVVFSGEKILDNVSLTPTTQESKVNDVLDKCGPIMLQGNHGSIDFRYLMLRPIKSSFQ